eukprot:gene1418-1642_t
MNGTTTAPTVPTQLIPPSSISNSNSTSSTSLSSSVNSSPLLVPAALPSILSLSMTQLGLSVEESEEFISFHCRSNPSRMAGRRPFLQMVVLYASDARVLRFAKEVQTQFLDGGIDVFLKTEENNQTSFFDEKIASKLTTAQKSVIRFHQQVVEAIEYIEEMPFVTQTDKLSTTRGAAVGPEVLAAAELKPVIGEANRERLMFHLNKILPKIEQQGVTLSLYGAPLSDAYFDDYRNNTKPPVNPDDAVDLKEGQWRCRLCTYINNEDAHNCAMCENPSPTLRDDGEWSFPGQKKATKKLTIQTSYQKPPVVEEKKEEKKKPESKLSIQSDALPKTTPSPPLPTTANVVMPTPQPITPLNHFTTSNNININGINGILNTHPAPLQPPSSSPPPFSMISSLTQSSPSITALSSSPSLNPLSTSQPLPFSTLLSTGGALLNSGSSLSMLNGLSGSSSISNSNIVHNHLSSSNNVGGSSILSGINSTSTTFNPYLNPSMDLKSISLQHQYQQQQQQVNSIPSPPPELYEEEFPSLNATKTKTPKKTSSATLNSSSPPSTAPASPTLASSVMSSLSSSSIPPITPSKSKFSSYLNSQQHQQHQQNLLQQQLQQQQPTPASPRKLSSAAPVYSPASAQAANNPNAAGYYNMFTPAASTSSVNTSTPSATLNNAGVWEQNSVFKMDYKSETNAGSTFSQEPLFAWSSSYLSNSDPFQNSPASAFAANAKNPNSVSSLFAPDNNLFRGQPMSASSNEFQSSIASSFNVERTFTSSSKGILIIDK